MLELNREDGGRRRFILCNNNENGICREALYPRIRKVLTGYSAPASRTEVLYQKKLSLADLAHGSDITQQLLTLAEQHQDAYDEIRRSFKNNVVMLEGIKKNPATVAGYPDNLRYYQTLFLPPQDARIRQACADLVAFQNEAYEPVQVHLNFHVYRHPDFLLILCFEGKYGWEAIAKHIRATPLTDPTLRVPSRRLPSGSRAVCRSDGGVRASQNEAIVYLVSSGGRSVSFCR